MTTIVNYGVGNLFSLQSSLAALGVENAVSANAGELLDAQRVILPGVGAFGDAMQKLKESGLAGVLREIARRGTPLLGICLGMQLLFAKSEEFGETAGLGLLNGEIANLDTALQNNGFKYKVPHMGWNPLQFKKPDSALLKYSHEGEYMYYVHSYYAINCESCIVASSEYGVEVPGVVQRGSVFGTQFHPEKSGAAGLNILHAFVEV